MDAGVTRREIERRVESGLLLAAYRGVYYVNFGPRPPLADEALAVLACRPQALLSHRSAAKLWKLPVKSPREVGITVVGRQQKPLRGVRLSSIASLAPGELRRHQRLPLTSPSLTLLDLAGLLGEDELTAAIHEARVQQIVTDRRLHASLASHPNRRGAAALRRFLARERGPRLTRSEAERRTLRVMRSHGLEPDASDYPVGPYRVDFYFRAEKVAVEYDSRQFHDNPQSFVSDRRRMTFLAARGILTFPLTNYDLGAGATKAMANLRKALEVRRPPATSASPS